MLTPRLTNCQDCHKIPDLLKKIDCKLAELGNDMYNNVVFMLGNSIPATTIMQLIAYKRILTFKYCNPHYAGHCSVDDIAGKVIRLTSGCVSRCNEPTVCEITTCCVDVVPNPTTTTTSTSSTTTTSTSSTTTSTTTIYPDCRVEGCFEVITETWNPNTYLAFTVDTSASFYYDVKRIAEISSIPVVVSKFDAYQGSDTQFSLISGTTQSNLLYIDDPSGEAPNSKFFLVVGMEVTGSGVPSGTTIVGFNGNLVQVNNSLTTSTGDILTFTLSSSAKTTDYNTEGNLRNLLQDYYATGLTQGEGNTDPATNGSDEFDSHLIYSMDQGEHQIKYLVNAGRNNALPIDMSPGGKFEGADNIIFQSFGDSSVFYTGSVNSDWANRQTVTDPTITDDVAFVKTTISNLETAAGNNTIYRGIFYTVSGGSDREQYEKLSTGLESGADFQNEMYAYTNEQLLVAESNGEPTRIVYVRNVPTYPQQNEWFDNIKNGLNQLGYNL